MMDKKILWIGLGMLVVLLLILLGYLAVGEKRSVLPPSPSPATNSLVTGTDYLSNLRVTFSDEVYPTDMNQPNPRLRHRIGRVQNLGNKTVTHLAIAVNYLDQAGEPIKDETINIGEVLKPNFIQEFQFGGLFVPAEWSGRVSYQVTQINFDHEPVVYYPQSPRAILDRSLPEIVIPLGI